MPSRASIRGVSVQGLRELDKRLGDLPKNIARNTLKRALVKAGQPIADAAKSYAPVEDGELRDSIQVSTRIKNTVGNAEFAQAMAAGQGIEAARAALRSARRAAKGAGSFAEVHVGPAQAKNKFDAIKRIVQEFGSHNQPGTPYMRPAWDANQDDALSIIKTELSKEISKSVARIAKRKAKV